MKYKLITFDIYSALFNIEGSIVPKLREIIGKTDKDLLAFFRTWRTKQWDYVLISSSLEKGFLSYKYITRCALDYTLKRFQLEVSEEDKEKLVQSWCQLRPWPEAEKVISELKNRGYSIGILSNGDEDMLSSLRDFSNIKIDYIFAADQAQAYKPSPKIYRLPCTRLGLAKSEFLHVAGSTFDMIGAKSEGLNCYWSNRFGDYPIDDKYKPDFEYKDLQGLLEIL